MPSSASWSSAVGSGVGHQLLREDEFLGEDAGREQPAHLGEVSIAVLDLADQFVGQVLDLPGHALAEGGKEAVRVADRRVLLRQPPCPVPHGHYSVPVHDHAAFPAGACPLASTLTAVMSWLTLRRDRPNRSAMARWLSGCPAATDAA